MEVKNYIVTEADKLFCQYGFKSVTMDDIAKHLGMSKKTIYLHFSDKNELVNILIREKLNSQDCIMKTCCTHAENAVQEVFFAITNMKEFLSTINGKLFYDLQKYHPKAWLYFIEFKEKKLAQTINDNINRGLAEGLYRAEINVDILTEMRLKQIDIIFNQHDNYTMNKYSLAQIMVELTEHFLHGVCNIKGLQIVEKYKLLTTQSQ